MNYLDKIKALVFCFILLIGVAVISAYTSPSSNPPANGNIALPLTNTSDPQYKTGFLAINKTGAPSTGFSLDVGGHILGTGLVVLGGADISGAIKSDSLKPLATNDPGNAVCADSAGLLVRCAGGGGTGTLKRIVYDISNCKTHNSITNHDDPECLWEIPTNVLFFKVETYGGGGGGGLNSKVPNGSSGGFSSFSIENTLMVKAFGGKGAIITPPDNDTYTGLTPTSGGTGDIVVNGSIGTVVKDIACTHCEEYVSEPDSQFYNIGTGLKQVGGWAVGGSGGKAAGPEGGNGGIGGTGTNYRYGTYLPLNTPTSHNKGLVLNFIKNIFSTTKAFAFGASEGSTNYGVCPNTTYDYETHNSNNENLLARVVPDNGVNGTAPGGGGGGAGWHHCNGEPVRMYSYTVLFGYYGNSYPDDSSIALPFFSGAGGNGGGYSMKTITLPATVTNRTAQIVIGYGGLGASSSSIYGDEFHGGNGGNGQVVVTYQQ